MGYAWAKDGSAKALMAKLNGRKTTAFFANIVGLDVVTVNGHAEHT